MTFALAFGCVARLPYLFMRQSRGVESCGWNICCFI